MRLGGKMFILVRPPYCICIDLSIGILLFACALPSAESLYSRSKAWLMVVDFMGFSILKVKNCFACNIVNNLFE
jgi:hypothetical protein